jgi:polycystin 1L2
VYKTRQDKTPHHFFLENINGSGLMTSVQAIPPKDAAPPAMLSDITGDEGKKSVPITAQAVPLKKTKIAPLAKEHKKKEGRMSSMRHMKSFRKKREKRREPKPKDAIEEIVTYLVFMCFFTLATLRDLNDTDIYYFGHQLKAQLAKMEFNEAHSPTFGKTFEDLATVEEFYHWMQGPLLWSVFSSHTFDGDPDWTGHDGKPAGYTLGHGKILGAVRISQLRATEKECNHRVPSVLASNYNWTCYGDDYGSLTGAESTTPFGNYSEWVMDEHGNMVVNKTYGPFLYEGRSTKDGSALVLESDVEEERSQYLSSFTTDKTTHANYPAPAFAMLIKPSVGEARAKQIIQNIVLSQYIDLHTKAVFVDLTVYNPMVDRICYIRMVGELVKAGGVMPTYEFMVVRLWDLHTSTDFFYVGLEGVIALFYAHYALIAYKTMRREGKQYWHSFLNVCQLLNILFFISQRSMRLYISLYLLPPEVPVDSWDYIEFLPAVHWKNNAVAIQAVNTFLNWFKLIHILSYSPTFRLMVDTLSKAADGVAGFGVVFCIIYFGFCQAHCVLFHGRLKTFRTITETCYTLLRSLLGDFDFLSLQQGHVWLGPMLFIIFIALAVFVVLNMLIAIISDAYAEVQEEDQKRRAAGTDIDLLAEIKEYMFQRTKNIPLVGKCVIRLATLNEKRKQIHDVEEHLEPGVGGNENEVTKEEDRGPSQSQQVLMEWYDTLQSNESEFSSLQAEMKGVKQDVHDLKNEFKDGLDRFLLVLQEVVAASKGPEGAKSPVSNQQEDSSEQWGGQQQAWQQGQGEQDWGQQGS